MPFIISIIRPLLAVPLLMLSLFGWGALITRVTRTRFTGELGVRSCIGMALVIAVAGVANLTARQTPALMQAMLAIGAVAGMLTLVIERRPIFEHHAATFRHAPFAWLGVWAALLIITAGAARLELHHGDDLVGYLVVLERTMQTGLYGGDVFNSRILETSLGGQNALLLLARTLLPAVELNAVDVGLGTLLGLLLIIDLAGRLGPARRFAGLAAVLWLMATCGIIYGRNLTTLGTAVGPFLALVRLLMPEDRDDVQPLRITQVLCAAIVLSGLCALKSSLIPGAGLLVGLLLLERSWRSPARLVALSAVMAIVTIGLLLPWMISMQAYVHTPLYPLLGKGYHGSAYGIYYAPAKDLKPAFIVQTAIKQFGTLLFPVTALLGLVCTFIARRDGDRRLMLGAAATLALLLGASLVDIATTGISIRYAFPQIIAAMLCGVLFLASAADGVLPLPIARLTSREALAGLCLLALGSLWWGGIIGFKSTATLIRKLPPDISAGAEISREMQAMVPAGERCLVFHPRAYQLDFRRNPIWHLDGPGVSSPPPGLPLGRDGQSLRDYLRQQQVRYMIVSMQIPDIDFFRGHTDSDNPWERWYSSNAVAWEKQLRDLRRLVKTVWERGDEAVLDLASDASPR